MRILISAGARPNFMKIASVVHALKKFPQIEFKILHTGQHYDENLSKIFFKELDIPKPDINLNVGSGSREFQLEEVSERFEPILKEYKPDVVIVVGDVNSTLACSQTAKRFNIKVAHVEAGLRSFDVEMPEEHNRINTDKISDFLFITEKSGEENLIREGIRDNKIHFVGNTMIDTLIRNLPKINSSKIKKELGVKENDLAVVTIHRPSNVDEKRDLQGVLNILNKLQKRIKVVFPIHPRTKQSLSNYKLMSKLKSYSNLLITEPLSYWDFLHLVKNSKFVFTDSGGIQEETTYMKIPCITLRFNTERPSTIEEGTNVLVGNNMDKAIEEVDKIMSLDYKVDGRIPKYWDGKGGERIVKILYESFVS